MQPWVDKRGGQSWSNGLPRTKTGPAQHKQINPTSFNIPFGFCAKQIEIFVQIEPLHVLERMKIMISMPNPLRASLEDRYASQRRRAVFSTCSPPSLYRRDVFPNIQAEIVIVHATFHETRGCLGLLLHETKRKMHMKVSSCLLGDCVSRMLCYKDTSFYSTYLLTMFSSFGNMLIWNIRNLDCKQRLLDHE